jgi:glycosyltransferase involved in cell wall biosynthesis
MRQVCVHLIPSFDTGGVEVAALSVINGADLPIDIHIAAIRDESSPKGDIGSFVSCFLRLYRMNMDLLIASLWRPVLIGILLKLLQPKMRFVVFIHNTVDKHLADRVITRIGLRLADEVWADSRASRDARCPDTIRSRARVISFVTRKIDRLPAEVVRPMFIFWGRLSKQKRVDHAMRIFARVRGQYVGSQFYIVGPDGGEESNLRELCRQLGLSDVVIFLGEKSFSEIQSLARKASFYLQTSSYEGMAMSVVEAMQLGLVPVVTSVGEISNYCVDGQNSMTIHSEGEIVERLNAVIQDNALYQRLSLAAAKTWDEYPLYRDSFLDACGRALDATAKAG